MENEKNSVGRMAFRMPTGFRFLSVSMISIQTRNPETLLVIFGMRRKYLFRRNGKGFI